MLAAPAKETISAISGNSSGSTIAEVGLVAGDDEGREVNNTMNNLRYVSNST